MTVAVDTNILFDILLPDPYYKDSSLHLLSRYMKTGNLIISEIVYSELASQFRDENLLKCFLNDANINMVDSSAKALWIAAKAWKKYAGVRDNTFQCGKCGKKSIYKCPGCNSVITGRQHMISDFIIAGHALVEAKKLLTRDRGFYRTYFAELEIQSE